MPYCTWGPESGGNYRARNPQSTAGGKYQILDTTWHAFGGPDYSGDHDAAQAPPLEQEKIARRVLAGQGIHAWVGC
jgi:muramidase (phage lysozyme)